ncbi:Hypothetical predicted protein [Octopus vulgaris]|uniref:Uncharacterized protein n=2 Tax=Octopus TaxID=6643 RepID=A0AA36AZ71_OCTVU|nr:uncharacterized protein LOC115213008 isoform X2 [Octopus sinensis]CAI9724469.1 Hypothetical predicted protein [Octopus vulgaris]
MLSGTLTDTRVILYDLTVLKDEGDDPKNAILYYYPETIDETELCNIFGQLMGMINIHENYLNSPPRSIYLYRGMYVFKHFKEYRLVLGSTQSQNESALLYQLQLLYEVFCLLQGNLKDVKKNITGRDHEDFLNKLKCVFDSYLPLCFQYDSVIEHSFRTIPSFKIPKTDFSIFMEVVTLLETSQRWAGVLGGCVLFKNKVVYSQLPLQLTRTLAAIHADLHNLESESVDIGSVPEGGSLTKLYVSSDIYTKLYETTLLPNSQQCNDSRRFSVTTAASIANIAEISSASKPLIKSALRPSKSLEVKTSESETDDDLLVRDDSVESDDKESAAKALAEQTKARAAYFTLISDSTLDSDTIHSRTSLKDLQHLRTASISLDVGETWPVINVRVNSKYEEDDAALEEEKPDLQRKNSKPQSPKDNTDEKLLIQFKNRPASISQAEEITASKIKSSNKKVYTSDSSAEETRDTSNALAADGCSLNDENAMYGSMLSLLSKQSGKNSIKPAFVPKPSLPECSTCIGDECDLILYVQNNSESSSMLLMEPSVCNMEMIQTLWKIILPKLGNLDYHFKKMDQHPKAESLRKQVMNSIVLDNVQQQLTGYERQKHPMVDAELEKMLLDIHNTFESYSTATDITLGSHCACTYGHKNPAIEAFFQKSFEQSLAFSPQASNMIFIMETLARNHLRDDKELVLV